MVKEKTPTSSVEAPAKPRKAPPQAAKTKPSIQHAANPSKSWGDLQADIAAGISDEEKRKAQQSAEAAGKLLTDYLHSALTTPNLVVLAGSGASLGKAGGPSMSDLWEQAKGHKDFAAVCSIVKHPDTDRWIENLLSRCRMAGQFLDQQNATKVAAFLADAEQTIWKACSDFLKSANLESHQTFLRRMARRRLRAPRLKLFTTNYDICFETAAGNLGITVIDGFSYSQPRRFDPRYFNYDLVRRAKDSDEAHDFVEGVIQILKLHGSVNWDQTDVGIVQAAKPSKPCLIYPTSTKYEQSYSEPHLELMAQFQAVLREPNTCLVTIGFGFNDNHLSAPILAAVKSNPSFKLLVVDRSAKDKAQQSGVFQTLSERIASGETDVALLNAEFEQFADLIPQLRALSPAEQLERAVTQIARKT
ncbi:MAG: SIR2 family protein [Planctomycetes bacterium]|nr:SIR2 family protein [Planctomycetota bacterium]